METLEIANELRNAGIKHDNAYRIAEIINGRKGLATRVDLSEVKQELKDEISEVKQELKDEISEVRIDIGEVKNALKDMATKEELAEIKATLSRTATKEELAEVKEKLVRMQTNINWLWIVGSIMFATIMSLLVPIFLRG